MVLRVSMLPPPPAHGAPMPFDSARLIVPSTYDVGTVGSLHKASTPDDGPADLFSFQGISGHFRAFQGISGLFRAFQGRGARSAAATPLQLSDHHCLTEHQ